MGNSVKQKIVRRIDKYIYEKPSNKRRLMELNWAAVFDFAIRGSEWFKRQGLNPGRWALGFPAFYVLYRTLEESRPERILELGLGESTKMTYQYKEHFGASLTVVEHDAEWRDIFCSNWADVSDVVKLLPLEFRGEGINRHVSYSGFVEAVGGKKYDLILVDGPWGSRHDSRNQILDIIEQNMLADDFVIIFDDAQRKGERQTIRKVKKLLKSKNMTFCSDFYVGEQSVCIICSPARRFLTTL